MKYIQWFAIAANRLGSKLRTEGLAALVKSLVHNYFFSLERCYLFYRPLSRSGRPLNPIFNFRLASKDDLPALGVFSSVYRREQFAEWFRDGDFVFLACRRGAPVAFQIVSPRSRRHEPFSHFVLNDRQVWIVDTYTLPEYRRNHLALQLREFRENILLSLGYTESVSTVRADNIASLSYVTRGVQRRVMYFTYVRMLWHSSIKLREDARGQLHERLLRAGVASEVSITNAEVAAPVT